ncbi:MAG: hypothetical protein CMF96_08965 [Candidatus Marinimicrobia bacterium]|nr:hypothetical protein [Candidatus Neomarinimicrobiota bacterium]|tara:strand:- start:97 stop:1356 length:1260 start_codon:yes stop_codon:yes gene_type:complete
MKINIFIITYIIFFLGCKNIINNNLIVGCLDETAFNYDPIAEIEGSCLYAEEKIYVSTQGYDQVNILNVIEGEVQDKQNIITVDYNENFMDTPHYIDIDKINNLWFVTLINSGKILMYDLNTNIILDSVFVGDSPALIAHDATKKRLYVSRMMPMNGMMGMSESDSKKIQVLDYSNQMLAKISDYELPAPAPHGLDISDNGNFLFVASNTSDWVYKIDTESGEILNEIFITDPNSPLPPNTEINYNKPIQLKYFDNQIFITCSAGKFYNGQTEEDIPGKIMVLNSIDLSIISTYSFEWYSTPWHIAIDEDNNGLFVALSGDMTNLGSAGISHLSFQNNEFIHHWTTTGPEFSSCHGIAISKIYNQVYLSGRGNGILHSINKNDGTILQSTTILMDNNIHHSQNHDEYSHGAMLGGIAVY